MIDKNEIITCKSYEEKLTDFQYHGPDLGNIPNECKSVWLPIEQLPFFIKEHGNDDREYIIVSSCSDIGVTYQEQEPPWRDIPKSLWMLRYIGGIEYDEVKYQGIELSPRYKEGYCDINDKFSAKMWSFTFSTFNEIPKCFKKWYMVNMSIHEPNVHWIPFGAAPKCEPQIYEAMQQDNTKDNLLYINFQISQEERWYIQRYFKTKNFPFVTFNNGQPLPYKDYLHDLGRHKFCLCPPGNGLDSYRILECLYMKCIPIVPYNRLTRHFTCYPMIFIDYETWINVFANLEEFDWEQFLNLDTENINWDIDQLKLSYWDKVINERITSNIC